MLEKTETAIKNG